MNCGTWHYAGIDKRCGDDSPITSGVDHLWYEGKRSVKLQIEYIHIVSQHMPNSHLSCSTRLIRLKVGQREKISENRSGYNLILICLLFKDIYEICLNG